MQILQLREISSYREELTDLLCNCVNGGASIGFVSPLQVAEGVDYWESLDNSLFDGSRIAFVALLDDECVGTVQLSLCQKKNGLHRAEVEKLMVHSKTRGKGIAKALMLELEKVASSLNRSLLVLDTRKGDVASSLYEAIGYARAGEIPDYASNADGGFDATVYYYKKLGV